MTSGNPWTYCFRLVPRVQMLFQKRTAEPMEVMKGQQTRG